MGNIITWDLFYTLVSALRGIHVIDTVVTRRLALNRLEIFDGTD